MRQVFIGAALIVAGIAAFIEASSHEPEYVCAEGQAVCLVGAKTVLKSGHISETAYDLLRIGGAALLIFGAAFVVVGVAHVRADRERP